MPTSRLNLSEVATVTGVYSPKGNSGSLVLRYREPAKSNQTPVPFEITPLVDAQVVQVFKVETGELILEGTFELDEQGEA